VNVGEDVHDPRQRKAPGDQGNLTNIPLEIGKE
jgi:hypothetical protein